MLLVVLDTVSEEPVLIYQLVALLVVKCLLVVVVSVSVIVVSLSRVLVSSSSVSQL